jgi:hypothetical protein
MVSDSSARPTMERYPLSWPAGWKRTPAASRTRARFAKGERQHGNNGGSWVRHRDLTVADGIKRVLGELGRFGVLEGDAIISTNIPTRLDGLPRSGAAEPSDPGVAVYWQRPGDAGTKCMAIDRYDRVADNLAAIAATLEAMRSIERHGGALILERAFAGFDALPAPGQTTARTWRDVLDVPAAMTKSLQIERARLHYHAMRSARHPDKGGSVEAFIEIRRAWEQAQAELA